MKICTMQWNGHCVYIPLKPALFAQPLYVLLGLSFKKGLSVYNAVFKQLHP